MDWCLDGVLTTCAANPKLAGDVQQQYCSILTKKLKWMGTYSIIGNGTDHRTYSSNLINRDWSWFFFFYFLRVEFCVKGKAGDTSEVSINIPVLGSTSAVTRTPSFSVRPLKISQSRRRQVFPWQRWKWPKNIPKRCTASLMSRFLYLCHVGIISAPPLLGGWQKAQ